MSQTDYNTGRAAGDILGQRCREQQERITELETTIKNVCDLINDEGKVSKWKILNILNRAKG